MLLLCLMGVFCAIFYELLIVKKLESAHHKFQRRMMGISWKDKVSNERVRTQTQLEKIDLIIKARRLRWLGHVLRMDDNRLPRQTVHWDISGTKRKL